MYLIHRKVARLKFDRSEIQDVIKVFNMFPGFAKRTIPCNYETDRGRWHIDRALLAYGFDIGPFRERNYPTQTVLK